MRFFHTFDPDDFPEMDEQREDDEMSMAMAILREDEMMDRYYEEKYNL